MESWQRYDQLLSDKIEILRQRRSTIYRIVKEGDIREYCAGGCAGRIAYQTGDIYGSLSDLGELIFAKNMELGRVDGTYSS